MSFERDSNKPSIDLVMHLFLGVAFMATVMAFADWPLLIDAMI